MEEAKEPPAPLLRPLLQVAHECLSLVCSKTALATLKEKDITVQAAIEHCHSLLGAPPQEGTSVVEKLASLAQMLGVSIYDAPTKTSQSDSAANNASVGGVIAPADSSSSISSSSSSSEISQDFEAASSLPSSSQGALRHRRRNVVKAGNVDRRKLNRKGGAITRKRYTLEFKLRVVEQARGGMAYGARGAGQALRNVALAVSLLVLLGGKRCLNKNDSPSERLNQADPIVADSPFLSRFETFFLSTLLLLFVLITTPLFCILYYPSTTSFTT
jgi:hypothetical protein